MDDSKAAGGRDPLPCTWHPEDECSDCILCEHLMCRLDYRDTVTFLINGLPFFVTAIAGTIVAGYGWCLLAWLAYALFFFFVWEGKVLCSHCPYWAEKGRTLHCHANAGVFKIWPYDPKPMSHWEGAQFIIGALILILFPLVLILLGQQRLLGLQWLLAGICLASAVSWFHGLWVTGCSRCINFSCPVNHVPKERVDAYLERNPVIREAWEASGYKLG